MDTLVDLVQREVLAPACADIFRAADAEGVKKPLKLYRHQVHAISAAANKGNFVVTSGTGSGKSLSFFIPIISAILKQKRLNTVFKTRPMIELAVNTGLRIGELLALQWEDI